MKKPKGTPMPAIWTLGQAADGDRYLPCGKTREVKVDNSRQ